LYHWKWSGAVPVASVRNTTWTPGFTVVPTGFRVMTGGVLTVSRTGTENADDALDIDYHFPIGDAKGVKFGFRLGLEYQLTPKWALELLLQQTELAGKDLSGDDAHPGREWKFRLEQVGDGDDL